MTAPDRDPRARTGLLLGLAAYSFWGLFPVYFVYMRHVPPLEMVSHRVVWSLLFLLLLTSLRGEWTAVRAALSERRTFLTLTVTSCLIATNWLVFIYAVETNEILQSSLGYFITPLVSVLLGRCFLGERLRRGQLVGLILAVCGVALQAARFGRFPWIALVLAATFGTYGLLRKTARVEAQAGLMVETAVAGPLALAYLLWLRLHGEGSFLAGSLSDDLLLPLAGVITSLPLIAFAAAARRLRLATIGFLQYITPTFHFLLAVVFYGEPFTPGHLVSFLCIWAGLACYSVDALRAAPRFSD